MKHRSVSYILASGVGLTESDIDLLIAFLKTLEDDFSEFMPQIVPGSAPSGLPVPALYEKE